MYFKINKACFCTVGLCTTSYISTALVLQFNSLVLYSMLRLCYATQLQHLHSTAFWVWAYAMRPNIMS